MADEISEPMRRNAVVLLQDGSVARRNVDGPEPLPGAAGCWTHYPVRPITEGRPRMDVVDPGWTVSWDQLAVNRVLYTAPKARKEK